MPKYFMDHTSLSEFEIMMQQPLNFQPRCCGVRLNEKKDIDPDKRPHGRCVESFIKSINDQRLTDRVHSMFSPKTTTPFTDTSHRIRTKYMASVIWKDSPSEMAAAFLLSVDPVVWLITCLLSSDGNIHFGNAESYGTSKTRHLLLKTAKDLYSGRRIISLDELCNSRIISDEMFRLIISAFVIRRYGLPQNTLQ